MSGKTVMMRLTVDVTYELNSTDICDQENALMQMVDAAAGMGWLGDGDAEITGWEADVDLVHSSQLDDPPETKVCEDCGGQMRLGEGYDGSPAWCCENEDCGLEERAED